MQHQARIGADFAALALLQLPEADTSSRHALSPVHTVEVANVDLVDIGRAEVHTGHVAGLHPYAAWQRLT